MTKRFYEIDPEKAGFRRIMLEGSDIRYWANEVEDENGKLNRRESRVYFEGVEEGRTYLQRVSGSLRRQVLDECKKKRAARMRGGR